MAFEDSNELITLTFEDGTECECLVWGFVTVDGQRYISLLPMELAEEDEDEEGDGCYIYQYDEDENGDPVLGYIEDDDVVERVIEAFDEAFDAEESEYDEIIWEEDEEEEPEGK